MFFLKLNQHGGPQILLNMNNASIVLPDEKKHGTIIEFLQASPDGESESVKIEVDESFEDIQRAVGATSMTRTDT